MNVFPKIDMNSIKETSTKKVLCVSYEGGYKQKRPQYTRKTKTFTLDYQALSIDEANTLEEFIMNNQGLSFIFLHPLSKKTYEVTYQGDSCDINYVSPLYRSMQVVLEEV